eukprot:5406113-Prymnesium_polylepis.1
MPPKDEQDRGERDEHDGEHDGRAFDEHGFSLDGGSGRRHENTSPGIGRRASCGRWPMADVVARGGIGRLR